MVSDVFVAGGQPTVTYIARDSTLEAKLRRYLQGSSTFLLLTGPTKSGKSVLCKHIIPNETCIWLSGGQIPDEDAFWMQAIHKLELSVRTTESTSNERATEFEAGAETAGIGALVARFRGGAMVGRKKGTASAREIAKDPKLTVLQALELGKETLVIDDFHYIPRDVQRSIVRALKEPVAGGQRIVLSSLSLIEILTSNEPSPKLLVA